MELKKFYFCFAPFLFLILIVGPVWGLSFFSFFYLGLAYLIPAALETPKLREKTLRKKYRFSFMRLLFTVRESSERLLPLKPEVQRKIGRHIPSLLFVNVIHALNPVGNLAVWFVGVMGFELSFWLYQKNFLNKAGRDAL